MTKLDQYQRLKKQVDDLGRQCSEARGKRDALLEQLRDRFGCSSLSEGQKLLRNKIKRQKVLSNKLRDLMSCFEETYGDRFE